ncbi:HET domain-containing protein [Colletotrichum higginsianum IMI 349063]|uniref:HET domain-containing protein n=2 Tax=Colletotrichum higginsianum (strain IMI 349063) TaxID=759273 RepID=A0A1B7YCM2_COLHI|nr:HET domain-containing protein [Colletotrichum higginsianum IMI 349063]OBR09765.1 HET domain-containing protein [Colletotrichum higginsianum IMI 349063]
MPVFNQYDYEPLGTEDALRLIALDPAVDERDPLSCRIFQRRRSAQREEYSAVSYTWGEQSPSRTLEIRCDDDDISCVRITSNVDALLRRFRARDQPCCLWIDAICLDQTNGLEKTQQVPLMGRIYGEAKDVCIWLGAEDRMTAKVLKLLRILSRLPEIQPQWDMAGRVVFHLNEIFDRDDALIGLRFLHDFFLRSWLTRRWVVQEAILAREATVHCGRHSIPLLSISWAATRFLSLEVASYPINMATNLREPNTKRGILELLWYFHEAECHDPKDRIAALFGLVPDGNRFHLDYTAHWTGLYRQVASSAFGLDHSATNFQLLIHLFEFGPVYHAEDASYPSWVPDWSKSRRRSLPFFSNIRNPDTLERYPTSSKGLEWERDGQRASWRVMGWDFRQTTMLAVKYVGEPSPQHKRNVSDGRMPLHKGKVIGPAVCVISEDGRNCTRDEPIDKRKKFPSEMDQWHSMRLI